MEELLIMLHADCLFTQVDSSGEIIQLEMHCPWVEHLFALEDKLSVSPSIKYVLYQEKESEKWRVQVNILLNKLTAVCTLITLLMPKYSGISLNGHLPIAATSLMWPLHAVLVH